VKGTLILGMTDMYTCECITLWEMEENSKVTIAYIYTLNVIFQFEKY